LRAPSRDKNPTKRRLYLPILDGNGNGHGNGEHVADTHVAHSIGCSQTAQPVGRRPDWLRVKAKFGPNFRNLKKIMNDLELHTVCEEAGCPNIFECWEEREATFLILGDRCTRRCGFCDVQTAKPLAVDEEEPEKIARAVGAMGLRHVVLTSVARDDLPDGGARIWAACIRAIRAELPECGVEVLTPDFKGDRNALATVMDAEPDVFQPWHWVTIPAIGIVHGEIFYLKELAEDCAADRVYEFFFCAPPLVITHGTGSPINPQAIK